MHGVMYSVAVKGIHYYKTSYVRVDKCNVGAHHYPFLCYKKAEESNYVTGFDMLETYISCISSFVGPEKIPVTETYRRYRTSMIKKE